MRYGSVCSGIEAATAAWHPLGWEPAFFSEIEPFPRAVLEHHYPDVPYHGDFTTIERNQYGKIDLLVGGTPCQSFSIAGLRGGLADNRGNLALEFMRLADRERPRWIVWENVPGVLSSNGGRDFGSILGALGELGYGFAYRVLDAQHFGVPQRRRRVFVVGYLGDWRRAAAVLFERHSLSGDTPPRREKGQGAPTIPSRSLGGGGLGTDFDCDGGLVNGRQWPVDVAPTLNAHYGTKWGLEDQHALGGAGLSTAHTLKGEGFDASEDGTGGGTPLVPVQQPYSIMPMNSGKDYVARPTDVAQPIMAGGPVGGNQGDDFIVSAIQAGALRENPESGPDGVGVRTDGMAYILEARAEVQAICFDTTQLTSPLNYSNPKAGDPCHPLAATAHVPAVAFAQNTRDEVREMDVIGALTANPGMKQTSYLRLSSAVRRLTPRECERLQGFPDDYTQVPYRNKPAADGPRYKALGNSMAVPVMRWIGERIQMIDMLYG